MTAPVDELPSAEDQAAMAILRARGYQVPDIQSLAKDQQSFAKRIPARSRTIAPGIGFQAQTMDLGDGCFTNAYTLRLDLNRVRTEVVSTADGFHLRDLLRADAALAAVSGSFSFISDDPTYQPAEPCLDFSCRGGEVVSLPTVTKPAFLVYQGKPMIGTLDATGTLDILRRTYRWIGSKVPRPDAPQPRMFTVFGAANCRVHYTDHPRTGFMRHVDQITNITPPDPSIIDYGQSSKIAFIKEDKTHVVGSMHYLRWPRSQGEPFRWQGLDGRVLHSGFIVTDSSPERAR